MRAERLARRRGERLLAENLLRLPRALLRALFGRREKVVLAQEPGADTPELDRKLARLVCAERPLDIHLLFATEGHPAQAEERQENLILPSDAREQAARLLSLLAERYRPVVTRAPFPELAERAAHQPRARFIVPGPPPQGALAARLRGRVTALGELGFSYLETLAVEQAGAPAAWDPALAGAAFFIRLWGRSDRLVVLDFAGRPREAHAAWLARAEAFAARKRELVVCALGAGGLADASSSLWTERHFGATAADRALLLRECDQQVGAKR